MTDTQSNDADALIKENLRKNVIAAEKKDISTAFTASCVLALWKLILSIVTLLQVEQSYETRFIIYGVYVDIVIAVVVFTLGYSALRLVKRNAQVLLALLISAPILNIVFSYLDDRAFIVTAVGAVIWLLIIFNFIQPALSSINEVLKRDLTDNTKESDPIFHTVVYICGLCALLYYLAILILRLVAGS